MERPIYEQVKNLPNVLIEALKGVGYGAKDVPVVSAEAVSPHAMSGDGTRGFVIIVNLATGQSELHYGSWGGANPFENRQVDLDTKPYPIPEGMAVIKGTAGYPRTFATVYLNPANVAKMLPPPAELTEREQEILRQFRSLTSAGRKNEWSRYPKSKPSESEIDSLVARGLLSKSRAGAVAITTAGKNSITHLSV
jgi:hypothetical protein